MVLPPRVDHISEIWNKQANIILDYNFFENAKNISYFLFKCLTWNKKLVKAHYDVNNFRENWDYNV